MAAAAAAAGSSFHGLQLPILPSAADQHPGAQLADDHLSVQLQQRPRAEAGGATAAERTQRGQIASTPRVKFGGVADMVQRAFAQLADKPMEGHLLLTVDRDSARDWQGRGVEAGIGTVLRDMFGGSGLHRRAAYREAQLQLAGQGCAVDAPVPVGLLAEVVADQAAFLRRQDVVQLLRDADADHDGTISFAEFEASY